MTTQKSKKTIDNRSASMSPVCSSRSNVGLRRSISWKAIALKGLRTTPQRSAYAANLRTLRGATPAILQVVHGASAAAFSPAMRPKAMHSLRLAPLCG